MLYKTKGFSEQRGTLHKEPWNVAGLDTRNPT